ncbi:urea transporter 2-like isoform X1 [Thunnus maccoyii]|uniref:urea transporter 2-like isoform X1 n=1 Tax=Thunnus maccoyii TaxID=8240 RepID=UPI001C4CFB4C|nr:urea transporter 2-like isoform X1 [Thunnus maccoyii]
MVCWVPLSPLCLPSYWDKTGKPYQRVYMATMGPWLAYSWLFSLPKETGTGGFYCQMCSCPCCGKKQRQQHAVKVLNHIQTHPSPVLHSALSSVASKWDLPVFTLPFNILVCLHVAATGTNHPYFPEVDIQPNNYLHPPNDSIESLKISQLLLSVPVGVSQVYGCDSPWKGGLILLALLLSSPTICFHAMLGSAAGMLSGLALAAPHRDIYSGLWGYNSALSCIAIGGVFYVLTWQTHLLALICALFCAYMTSAISKLMSVFALPACTWPFCLSTLIFLLISSEIPAICRLPLSVVSYPEENRRYHRQLEALEKAQHSQQSGGQEEAPLKEN